MLHAQLTAYCADLSRCPGWTQVLKPMLERSLLAVEKQILDADSLPEEEVLFLRRYRQRFLAEFATVQNVLNNALQDLDPNALNAFHNANATSSIMRALFCFDPHSTLDACPAVRPQISFPESPKFNPFDPTTLPPPESPDPKAAETPAVP